MTLKLHSSRPQGIHRSLDFGGTMVANIVRRIRADLPRPLSDADNQFLKDVARGRYTLAVALPRLVDLSCRCVSDAGGYALIEELGVEIASRRKQLALPIADKIVHEDTAEHSCNAAVRAWTLDKSPVAARRAAEECKRHSLVLESLSRAFSLVAGGAFA